MSFAERAGNVVRSNAFRVTLGLGVAGLGCTELVACGANTPQPKLPTVTQIAIAGAEGFGVDNTGHAVLVPGHCYTDYDPVHMVPSMNAAVGTARAYDKTHLEWNGPLVDVSAQLATVNLSSPSKVGELITNADAVNHGIC